MFGLIILAILGYLAWYFLSSRQKNPTPEVEPPVIINYPPLVAISLALVVIAYNLGLHDVSTYLSFPVLGLALANSGWVLAWMLSAKNQKWLSYLLAVISVVSGWFLVWRANGFVQSVDVSVMILANLSLVFLNSFKVFLAEGLWLVKQAWCLIGEILVQVPRLIKNRRHGGHGWSMMSVIKTLGLTLIVLVVFINLLSSADPVFAQIIKEFQEQALSRTFISLLVIFGFLVLITVEARSKTEEKLSLGFLSLSDIVVPVSAIVALFAVFIVVQVKYLFGSQVDFQAFNLTYSSYVRKGFLELLTTTFFGGLIAYIVILKNQFHEAFKRWQLIILNSCLIGELYFMLASALKRDLMYVEVYGLTRVRVVGGLFLVWLAGLLALLLIITWQRKIKEALLWSGVLVLSIFVWLGLNLINVDQIVAQGAPEHHDYTDYFYLDNLSEDGYLAWQNSLPLMQDESSKLLAKTNLTEVEKSQLAGIKLGLLALKQKRTQLYLKYENEAGVKDRCLELNCSDQVYELKSPGASPSSISVVKPDNFELKDSVKKMRLWQHYNQSEYQVFKYLQANETIYFDRVDQLLKQIRDWQQVYQVSLYREESRLLYELKYPFINISLRNYSPEFYNFNNSSYPPNNSVR